MTKTLGLLALVLMTLPLHARGEEGRTAAELMSWCSEIGTKGIMGADAFKNGMCQGTLRGFITAADFENARGNKFSVCIPDGTPDIDLVAAFNDWASKNSDKSGDPEWFAVYNALHLAFPCGNSPAIGK